MQRVGRLVSRQDNALSGLKAILGMPQEYAPAASPV